jgi:hypothetical protein
MKSRAWLYFFMHFQTPATILWIAYTNRATAMTDATTTYTPESSLSESPLSMVYTILYNIEMHVYLWAIIILIAVLCVVIYNAAREHHYDVIEQKMDDLLPDVEYEQAVKYKKVVEEQPHVRIIDELMDEYRRTRDPEILLKIGDFYRKGMYSIMKSDNAQAIRYYEIAAKSRNKQVAEIAQGKYMEAAIDAIPEEDDIGEVLDEIPADVLYAALTDDVPVVEPIVVPDTPIFLNDMQNVHDHYMNKITASNVKKLKEMNNQLNPDIKSVLIRKLAEDDELDINDKASIKHVLNQFSSDNKQFDISEIESLQLVNAYIDNSDNKKDMIHNLFLQLKDCAENGTTVCTTGKISRVMSVVGDTEEFETPRNIYYIKQELEQLAAKVRDDVLANLSEEDVKKYNESSPDSEPIVENMKKIYQDKVKEEYYDKLHIEPNIVKPHVNANLLMF